MKSFWDNLPRPFFALAPLANVTDVAFRRIIAKYGKPDVLWTEFVSADGLMSKGREALLVDLLYSESERPIVAQLFSGNPEKMFEAGKLIKELGFDGLDINMGCPDRSIEKSGAGAALIKNPNLARAIIRAAKEGVASSSSSSSSSSFYSPLESLDSRRLGALPSSAGGMLTIPTSEDVGTPFIKGDKSSASEDLGTSFNKGGIKISEIPVSIKTRLGYNKDVLEEWLPELLAEKPAAITIHARTRKEMSKVPAHWERVKRAVEIRNTFFSSSSSFKEEARPTEQTFGRVPSLRGGGVMDSLGTPPQSPSSKEGEARTLILGNGDVKDLADARAKAQETGVDGIMLGRAIFGNPWLFRRGSTSTMTRLSLVNRLNVLVEHTKLFEELLMHPPSLKLRRAGKNFAIMKKHFKAYVEGFDGAKELRMKLMETENASEVEVIVAKFLSKKNFLV